MYLDEMTLHLAYYLGIVFCQLISPFLAHA